MRDDYCVFILTHGRPTKVRTVNALKRANYTGPLHFIIDDEDATADEYRALYGSAVHTFSKAEVARSVDEGDNTEDRRAIVYARHYAYTLARKLGYRYFVMLDDDYNGFWYRFSGKGEWRTAQIRQLNRVFEVMIDYYESVERMSTIALAQGGDFIGGGQAGICLRRKAMNTFICSVDRPINFVGRLNEDVSTYTEGTRRGLLFFTTLQVAIVHLPTQGSAGGMTEAYLDGGTYLKAFYSVMYAPSGVKIGTLVDNRPGTWSTPRIHHSINWHVLAPKILREHHRKPR